MDAPIALSKVGRFGAPAREKLQSAQGSVETPKACITGLSGENRPNRKAAGALKRIATYLSMGVKCSLAENS